MSQLDLIVGDLTLGVEASFGLTPNDQEIAALTDEVLAFAIGIGGLTQLGIAKIVGTDHDYMFEFHVIDGDLWWRQTIRIPPVGAHVSMTFDMGMTFFREKHFVPARPIRARLIKLVHRGASRVQYRWERRLQQDPKPAGRPRV